MPELDEPLSWVLPFCNRLLLASRSSHLALPPLNASICQVISPDPKTGTREAKQPKQLLVDELTAAQETQETATSPWPAMAKTLRQSPTRRLRHATRQKRKPTSLTPARPRQEARLPVHPIQPSTHLQETATAQIWHRTLKPPNHHLRPTHVGG